MEVAREPGASPLRLLPVQIRILRPKPLLMAHRSRSSRPDTIRADVCEAGGGVRDVLALPTSGNIHESWWHRSHRGLSPKRAGEPL